jgi:hypothetical protein
MQLGSYLAGDKNLKDHLSFLQLAFKISADELNGIIQIEFADLNTAKLTLANVSSIYRYSVLSRGLGITISDLLQLIPLFKDINPFAALKNQAFEQPTVNRSLSFIETVQKIKRSAFKNSDLKYVMNDKEDVFNSLFNDLQLTGFLEEIQAGIKALATQHPSPDQSEIVYDTTFLQAQLPTLFTDDISAVLVAMINGSIEYSTKIPPGATAVIPDGLKRKYVFENNVLTCRGIMTDKEQGELMNAEAGNAAWKAGVDKIYTAPEKFITEKLSSIFTDTAAAIKTLLFHKPGAGDVEKTAAQKIKFTYEQMYPVLIKKIPDQLVNAAVSSLLGLPADAGEMFIDENTCQLIRDSKKDDPGPLKKLLVPLHKIALFVSGFKLSYKEIKYIKDSKDKPDVFDSLDFTNLKAIHWQRICNYVLLRDSLKINNDLLIDFFLTGKNDLLSIACNWPKKDLELIIAEFGFAGNALKNEKALIVITKCMEMINRTGLAAEVLISWAKADAVLNFDTCFDLSLTIKELVKAKYEDDEWLEVAKKLTDSLRENQRQALVTFLCNKLDLDEGELTEKFLIDVSVCACMDASQIKLAIGSIHLFVNQCFLNLRSKIEGGKEKGVAAKAINKRNWDDYMHSVVLWEAYRKVIIHASDYLDPKWLFEMSPIFKKCRSEMTQGDITNESAKSVFKLYAQELHEVANLIIVSLTQQNFTDGGFVLHVIGRTAAAPYKFHYRTCDHLLNCSAWELITEQVKTSETNTSTGVHIFFSIIQDRKYIYAIEFEKRTLKNDLKNSDGSATRFDDLGGTNVSSMNSVIEYWVGKVVRLEYINGKWTNKKYLAGEILFKYYDRETGLTISEALPDISHVNAKFTPSGNSLTVEMKRYEFMSSIPHSEFLVGFKIEGDSLTSFIYPNDDEQPEPTTNIWDFQIDHVNGAFKLKDNIYLNNSQVHKLVYSTDKTDFHQTLQYPFIYQDQYQSYLVFSENITYSKSIPLEEEPTTMLAKFRNTTAAESVIVRSRHNDTQEVFNGINHIIVNNP